MAGTPAKPPLVAPLTVQIIALPRRNKRNGRLPKSCGVTTETTRHPEDVIDYLHQACEFYRANRPELEHPVAVPSPKHR
jgi:hypothetical protein